MSRLNQKAMGVLLKNIFGVAADYVVPKQGNWYNPQARENGPTKPKTWCAYRLGRHTPFDLPHYMKDSETPVRNWSVQTKISTLTLQFVGDAAEDLANSIGHWPHRADAQQAFNLYNARVLGDVGDVIVTDFAQEGTNTVLAYNVEVRIVWPDEIDTEQGPMPKLVFEGKVV